MTDLPSKEILTALVCELRDRNLPNLAVALAKAIDVLYPAPAPAPLPTKKPAEYTKGPVFDDHGQLARWLGNEPTIIVCDEPRACKDLLEWDAGRLFHALARGELARAAAKPAAPAPLPCPFCGGNATTREHWTECEVCDTSWPTLYANRRAPCPECAKARTEAGIRQQIAARAIERMQVAEARCAEADSRPGGVSGADRLPRAGHPGQDRAGHGRDRGGGGEAMLTTEQRALLRRVRRMPKMDRAEAEAIDAALATIDQQAAELAQVKAAKHQDVMALARAYSELALLRRVADGADLSMGGTMDARDAYCVWRRVHGGQAK